MAIYCSELTSGEATKCQLHFPATSKSATFCFFTQPNVTKNTHFGSPLQLLTNPCPKAALVVVHRWPPFQDNCPHGTFLPISGPSLGACAKHQLQVRKSFPGENSDAPLLLRGFAKFRLFAMFPVLLTILLMWALCAILTQVLMAMVE